MQSSYFQKQSEKKKKVCQSVWSHEPVCPKTLRGAWYPVSVITPTDEIFHVFEEDTFPGNPASVENIEGHLTLGK